MAQLGPAPKPQPKREQNSSRAALVCAAALTSKEIKKRRKELSREGTKLKFVTGPRLAHEHGENRAQKDDLMVEPENLTPPSSPDPNT